MESALSGAELYAILNTGGFPDHAKLTSKFSSGLHITAALQRLQNGGQAVFFLHLHLVFVTLVNGITQSPGGEALHDLIVAAEELQELFDPAEIVDLDMRGGY